MPRDGEWEMATRIKSGMVEFGGDTVIVDKLTVYLMYNWHGGEVHIV